MPQDGAGTQDPPATTEEAAIESTYPTKALIDSSKWISWFSKSSTTLTHNSPLGEGASAKIEPSLNDLGEPHGTTVNLSKPGPVDGFKPAPELEELPSSLSSGPANPAAVQTESRNWSWLGLWKDAAIQPKSNVKVADSDPTKETRDNSKPQDSKNSTENLSKPGPLNNSTAVQPSALPKSAGWVFWSKDRSQDESPGQTGNAGKLILAELPSQSPPDNDVVADPPKNLPQSRKQERPQSIHIRNEIDSKELVKAQPSKGKASSTAVEDSSIKSTEKSEIRTKKDSINLVLPAFKVTYKPVGKPSFFQQISRLLKYTRPPDTKHVNLLQEPARIRNALAIVRQWELGLEF